MEFNWSNEKQSNEPNSNFTSSNSSNMSQQESLKNNQYCDSLQANVQRYSEDSQIIPQPVKNVPELVRNVVPLNRLHVIKKVIPNPMNNNPKIVKISIMPTLNPTNTFQVPVRPIVRPIIAISNRQLMKVTSINKNTAQEGIICKIPSNTQVSLRVKLNDKSKIADNSNSVNLEQRDTVSGIEFDFISDVASRNTSSNIKTEYDPNSSITEASTPKQNMIQTCKLVTNISNYNFEQFECSGEMSYEDAYEPYKTSRSFRNIYYNLKREEITDHPYNVVESLSLANVEAPELVYRLRMKLHPRVLSDVQLEAILYACQSHDKMLPVSLNNSNDPILRSGFFIGDGAGMGKGRIIAGIIVENVARGRTRHVWISVSNDLLQDARRDLNDIGAENIEIRNIGTMNYEEIAGEKNKFEEGVLFVTYSSLISKSKNSGRDKFCDRYQQIMHWLKGSLKSVVSFDGVIVLDECHRAKNYASSNGGKLGGGTMTGETVRRLQRECAQARVLYASATGASEPSHMGYLDRLLLWGPGSAFKQFANFEQFLDTHGVAAMELISMHMKMSGVYLARQLSFKDVQFEIQQISLSSAQLKPDVPFLDVYNRAVNLWSVMLREFLASLKRNGTSGDNRSMSQFWSAHQRFFKYLCISGKVQKCCELTQQMTAADKCVVIGLQSTGEANTADIVEENVSNVSEFISSAVGVVKNLIKKHFPSNRNIDKSKVYSKNVSEPNLVMTQKPQNFDESVLLGSECEEDDVEIVDPLVNDHHNEESEIIQADDTEQDKRAIELMSDLINQLQDDLPMNALDDIIGQIGGPDSVAEMTGRKVRLVKLLDGKVQSQPRREDGSAIEQTNLIEKQKFNSGEKLVAVISDAASTGISLHSDKRFKNRKQRIQLTLELPWSADKAIQQFGRTHRSNQNQPPHYIFLISDVAGEQRFAASVAKRMQALGALTHGDRRTADSRDLSQFNIDTKVGLKAAEKTLDNILSSKSPEPRPVKPLEMLNCTESEFLKNSQRALMNVGLMKPKLPNVTRFLNRLLGIPLNLQNAIFQYFQEILDNEIQIAKLRNEFDHGIRSLYSDSNTYKIIEREIYEDDRTDQIDLFKVENTHCGVTWEEAEERYNQDTKKNKFVLSSLEYNSMHYVALAEYVNGNSCRLISPNFKEKFVSYLTLRDYFSYSSASDVKTIWNSVYEKSEKMCHHKICTKHCKQKYCGYGSRVTNFYVLTGSILRAWSLLDKSVSNLGKMDIVRIKLDNAKVLNGAMINCEHLGKISFKLRENYTQKKTKDIYAVKVKQTTFGIYSCNDNGNDDGNNNGREKNKYHGRKHIYMTPEEKMKAVNESLHLQFSQFSKYKAVAIVPNQAPLADTPTKQNSNPGKNEDKKIQRKRKTTKKSSSSSSDEEEPSNKKPPNQTKKNSKSGKNEDKTSKRKRKATKESSSSSSDEEELSNKKPPNSKKTKSNIKRKEPVKKRNSPKKSKSNSYNEEPAKKKRKQ